ncbi:pseudouridine synthase [Pelagibius sp.]|uniref:pseudouridine synthase n=1 Tax=Pelagibius sp. TaxID=1931238 RepID=UPI00261C4975|nr:pseudouridine synthase [Pelagibius sp.]
MAEIQKGERIAKVIARAGLCSRRDAEAWIAAGRVSLDGRVLDSPAAVVTAESRIEVDGTPLPEAEPARLWRYHKPRGELTTARDPQGRTTVFDRLPPELPRLQAVGRLDINSEGLLLMTNDGALKRQLELPANGWLRRYRVRVHGRVSTARLAALAKGVTVEGVNYGPVEASLDQQTGANAWLTVGLREGKNREVRKICAHLGLAVNRLIRVSYGPFTLGKLPNRGLEEVPAQRLRQALGLEKKEKQKRGKGFAKAKPKPNRPGSRRGFKKPEHGESGDSGPQRKGAAAKKTGTKKTAAKKPGAKKAVSKAGAGRRGPKAAKSKSTQLKSKSSKPKFTKSKSAKSKSAKSRSVKARSKSHANRRRPS